VKVDRHQLYSALRTVELALKTAVFAQKSWLEKIFGIFLPGRLQFIFARIILPSVADESQ